MPTKWKGKHGRTSTGIENLFFDIINSTAEEGVLAIAPRERLVANPAESVQDLFLQGGPRRVSASDKCESQDFRHGGQIAWRTDLTSWWPLWDMCTKNSRIAIPPTNAPPSLEYFFQSAVASIACSVVAASPGMTLHRHNQQITPYIMLALGHDLTTYAHPCR